MLKKNLPGSLGQIKKYEKIFGPFRKKIICAFPGNCSKIRLCDPTATNTPSIDKKPIETQWMGFDDPYYVMVRIKNGLGLMS
jgi:hypothetical protein